jgi:hypothetical protein
MDPLCPVHTCCVLLCPCRVHTLVTLGTPHTSAEPVTRRNIDYVNQHYNCMEDVRCVRVCEHLFGCSHNAIAQGVQQGCVCRVVRMCIAQGVQHLARMCMQSTVGWQRAGNGQRATGRQDGDVCVMRRRAGS